MEKLWENDDRKTIRNLHKTLVVFNPPIAQWNWLLKRHEKKPRNPCGFRGFAAYFEQTQRLLNCGARRAALRPYSINLALLQS